MVRPFHWLSFTRWPLVKKQSVVYSHHRSGATIFVASGRNVFHRLLKFQPNQNVLSTLIHPVAITNVWAVPIAPSSEYPSFLLTDLVFVLTVSQLLRPVSKVPVTLVRYSPWKLRRICAHSSMFSDFKTANSLARHLRDKGDCTTRTRIQPIKANISISL